MAWWPSPRRTIRNVLFGLLAGTAVGIAIWMIGLDGPGREEISAIVGLFVAIMALANDIVSGLLGQPEQRRDVPALADDLARIVREEWLAEAKARMLRNPGVLPLAWSAARPGAVDSQATVSSSVADATVIRLKDGRLASGFDAGARQLAIGYETVRTLSSGRLVVLGEPGAGKTVLAMMLTIGLLEARSAGAPTPVLLSAASWDPVMQPLDDWIVGGLAGAYYSGREEIPRLLLGHGLLLPILDGLDEIPESARRSAVREINYTIGRDRPVVVTCRSAEYEDVIKGGAPVLRGAPVVQVLPLVAKDVIDYLEDVEWPEGVDWSSVYNDLRAFPDGPVATALSTPLLVSVARTVYQRGGGDPAELLSKSFDSRHAVEDHLIDQLIEAVYAPHRRPGGQADGDPNGERRAAQARRWLTFLARHLHQHRERDLAWWQLSQRTLSAWVAPGIGIAGGAILMVVVAASSAAVLSTGPDKIRVDNALAAGAIFGAGYMVLAIVTWYATAGRLPGRVSFAVRGSLGRLRRGFVTGAALVAIPALPSVAGFATVVSISEGWSFRYIENFFVVTAAAVGIAALIGVALAVHNWLDAPPERAGLANPLSFLQQDRRSSLVGAAAAGVVVAVGLAPSLIVAMVIGGGVAQALTGWPGLPGEPDLGYLIQTYWHELVHDVLDIDSFQPMLAFLAVLPGVVFGLIVLLTRAWSRFLIARVILAARGQLPLRLMAFLSDARERQLLRQSGGRYQFRHVRLQERLASQPLSARPSAHPSSDARISPAANSSSMAAGTAKVRSTVRRRALPVVASVVLLLSLTGLVRAMPVDSSRATLRGHTNYVELVVFGQPDGRRLVSASNDGTVRLWDPATGRTVATFPAHKDDSVPVVALSPDGHLLAIIGDDGVIKVWNAITGRAVATLTNHRGSTDTITFSPDGTILAVASTGEEGEARLWDSATWQEITHFSGHAGGVSALVFSPDGNILATASLNDRRVRLRDPHTGATLHYLPGHNGGVSSVVFAPDGQTVVTTDGPLARLWNPVTGHLIATLAGHTKDIVQVVYSPNSRRLATGSNDATARLWDATTGQLIAPLTGHTDSVQHVLFSPDSRTLATAADWWEDTAPRLWDAVAGDLIATLAGHDRGVRDLAFSPKGRNLIATASDDETARLWDATTGRPVASFLGHTDRVLDVAFSPDGRSLATASDDNTVRLWDIPAL